MHREEGTGRSGRHGWAALLGGGVAASAVALATMAPPAASTVLPSTVGHHATHRTGLGDELAQVRAATAQFHRVDQAVAAGYELGWVNGAGVRIVAGCVSHPSAGAMGYHYFNADLMADDTVDLLQPEVLVYAPAANGELRLAAVEWVARSAMSNPPGVSEAPSVLGMDMHILVPPPGPAFYLTHAWVWMHNPAGMFADWNPEVTC